MKKRQQRAKVAQETLHILDAGHYKNQQGKTVPIASLLTLAKEHSIHYLPESFQQVFALRDDKIRDRQYHTVIEVTNETTLQAAQRLSVDEHEEDVLCLNFASAKNPGGGFLGGSQAQEESLARASGLYPCIAQMTGYYESNRTYRSCLYTDNMIYSPQVPVFRDDQNTFLDMPYTVSFITAPAVNHGAVARNESHNLKRIHAVMFERIAKVLSLCIIHDHSVLVLGAWGCGVFKNRPDEIASLFRRHLLEGSLYTHAFKRIVFAVFDRTKELTTFTAFDTILKRKTGS